MINIRIDLSYDGSKYNGWQKQGNTDNTIQEKLETTLGRYFGCEIELAGSGRTDAGVNAICQVANFKISEDIYNKYNEKGISNIQHEINEYLPKDIRIINIKEVDLRFHSRLNAVKKHYSYRIDNGEIADIFRRKYLYRIEEKLNIIKMNEAAECFIGEHDFFGFQSNKKMKKSSVREIYDIKINENNGIIKIDFVGNGFLYNMVRIITGTILEVGLGKREIESIYEIFETKDRSKAGFTAPANALFLEEVIY